MVVEIKPLKDLKEPDPNPKRRTKSWVYSVKTWAINHKMEGSKGMVC